MTNQFSAEAKLSAKTAATAESAIQVMSRRARELRGQGAGVLNLTIGEPDFETPGFIKEAAERAMAAGHTHYPPIPGVPVLREAIARKYARENNVLYAPDEVVVSNGAKQAITNACFAMLDAGDDVLLLSPFWAAYSGIIEMAGGCWRTVHAGADQGFKVTPDQLEAALRPETKLLFLNNPCNPTGAVYSLSELKGLAAVVARHPRVMVVSDEIYEYITFDEEFVSFATLPGMKERTITVNGVSKGFAMTGWRLGYAVAPEPVAVAISKVQGTFTAGANAFVQHAAAAALNGPREDVFEMRNKYRNRRNIVVQGLENVRKLILSPPPGTFYAFPDVSAYLGKVAGNRRLETSFDIATWLLEDHFVATVPGSAFGDDNALRLSFATGEDVLRPAVERMQIAFASVDR